MSNSKILRKDNEWKEIEDKFCKVLEFNPIALVKNSQVITSDKSTPYASVILRCEGKQEKIKGYITHKIDFFSLWQIFKERKVSKAEEVNIVWTTKQYKYFFVKYISVLFPKLRIMVCPKEAFELLTDLNFRTDLTGKKRAMAEMPILDLKPDIMIV
ncbi:MAG TPA: hypothetical protein VMR41_02935 [Patescibacteria group bacterium]|nr:hypothetical protein [Patescibacteria group bacterium]